MSYAVCKSSDKLSSNGPIDAHVLKMHLQTEWKCHDAYRPQERGKKSTEKCQSYAQQLYILIDPPTVSQL